MVSEISAMRTSLVVVIVIVVLFINNLYIISTVKIAPSTKASDTKATTTTIRRDKLFTAPRPKNPPPCVNTTIKVPVYIKVPGTAPPTEAPTPVPARTYPGLAITIGFNHRQDPQRGTVVEPSFDYIAPWYESLHQHPDMKGLVIEDMYDSMFRNAHTDSQVSFYHLDPNTHPSFTNVKNSLTRSINDQRYFVMESYLNESASELEDQFILMSDCHDLTFLRNPFEFMAKTDEMLENHQLFVGNEFKPVPGAFQWNVNHWKECFDEDMPYVTEIFSAGIIGGHISVVRKLLRKMNELFLVVNQDADCNMNVMQKVITSDFNDTVVTGYPLHSKFKEYEKHSMAFIKHK